MTVYDTAPRYGLRAWLGRISERINVSICLHYAEKDAAYERAMLDRLPAKVRALEQHAEHLRVRLAVLRSS